MKMQERKMGDMKIRDMNIRENEYAGQTYAKSNVYTMKLIKFKLTVELSRPRRNHKARFNIIAWQQRERQNTSKRQLRLLVCRVDLLQSQFLHASDDGLCIVKPAAGDLKLFAEDNTKGSCWSILKVGN